MKKIKVAVVGVTGLVGRTFLKILEKSGMPISGLVCFASERNEGKLIKFAGKNLEIKLLSEKNVKKFPCDYAFFAVSEELAAAFAPVFVETGATVIDNSSAHRMIDKIPLVVPEVNFGDISEGDKIIANPNCSTIQCMLPLKALHDVFLLEKTVYTSFQAVSGSGTPGLEDLRGTAQGRAPRFYTHPIFNNCLPHIGGFLPSGFTKEEEKMIRETQKILHLPNLSVSATCVRVPIENSHSVAVSAGFKNEIDLAAAVSALKNFENVEVFEGESYPVPTMATGKDKVLVGRIRTDLFDKKTLHFFCVCDNILKGAALNGAQILERLLKNGSK